MKLGVLSDVAGSRWTSTRRTPLPPFFNEINGFNTLFLRFGSIAVVCLRAIASWKLFESPIIRLGNRLTDRTRTSVMGVQDTEAGPVALR
jgi:peptidoglycan/LPS O-acetylase OafA/YrhL